MTKTQHRASRAYKADLRRRLSSGRKKPSNVVYVATTNGQHILCACIGRRAANRIMRALEQAER